MMPEPGTPGGPAAPAVAAGVVEDAFRFFLGRRPDPGTAPRFASVPEMNLALLRSREFRASPRAQKTALGWPLRQVFVSRPAKVIYCPIGKNACTFLKQQMLRISGLPDIGYAMHNIHLLTDQVRTGLQLGDHPADEAAALIADPGYMKFALLRDPASRLLSAYREKFVVNRAAPGNFQHTRAVVAAVQGRAEPDFARGISFRDFVTQIVSCPPESLDTHWRPQHLYLAGIRYDRLYRIEELDRLVDDLEARSGVALPRKPQNVTGADRAGRPHPGAADLLPAEIEALPRLAGEDYLAPGIGTAIRSYFAADYALIGRPASERLGTRG